MVRGRGSCRARWLARHMENDDGRGGGGDNDDDEGDDEVDEDDELFGVFDEDKEDLDEPSNRGQEAIRLKKEAKIVRVNELSKII